MSSVRNTDPLVETLESVLKKEKREKLQSPQKGKDWIMKEPIEHATKESCQINAEKNEWQKIY